MTDLLLYHAAPSRSSVTHWMLEELGEPFELRVLDLEKEENRQADYLAVNPMGKVPALAHKGVVIAEVAAICTYLADEFPEKQLNVPVGSPKRGLYLKWLFFGPSCLEPAITDKAFDRPPVRRGALGYGEYDTVLDVVADAVSRGAYLMGERFTAADVVLGSGVRWGMMFGMLPKRPEFTAYAERLEARPALRRATKTDERLMRERESRKAAPAAAAM